MNSLWISDFDFLWNNKKSIYGTVKENIGKLSRNDQVLLPTKGHPILTLDEFKSRRDKPAKK